MSKVAKIQQIRMVADMLKGKRVKIFTAVSGHMLTGDIASCSDNYLTLKNVEWWNGDKHSGYAYDVRKISKIEVA